MPEPMTPQDPTDGTVQPISAPTPAPARSPSIAAAPRPHRRSERAEGVISTAIAVLIVAFLGIALWTGFDSMMNSATERTRTQVEQIGG